jgi:polyisoprenoid-binding protein YceI
MKNTAVSISALAGLIFSQAVMSDDWRVDYDTSRLGFIATYDEIPFQGRFREFDARILFDPETPSEGSFIVTIEVASVDTDSPDRDEGMLESEWFDAAHFPAAHFESMRFERGQEQDMYTANGDLSIKGIRKPVEVMFRWTQSDASVRLNGYADITRGNFDIGTGDWADDDTIGYDVKIEFELILTK